MAHRCLTLFALTIALPVLAQPLPSPAKSALRSQLRFSAAELEAVEAGKAAAHVVETGNPEDVLIVGAIRIAASPAEFVRRYRNVVEFESGPGIPASGKFSSPPQAKDLAGFSLPRDAINDLRECEPGDCSFKASADGIQRIRSSVDWKSPNYVAEANQLIRGMWLEYLLRYQSKGNTALVTYHDSDKVSRVEEGVTTLVNTMPAFREYVPEVANYLLRYPQGKPAGSEEFFYWQVANFGLKPVHRVTHVVIHSKPGEAGEGYLIANKMLYASHYFRSALELRFLIPVRTADSRLATYMVVVQRSYVDGLTGVKGKLIRGPIMSKSRDALQGYLVSCKAQLEKS